MKCPAALTPGAGLWGIYQEAYRRAAEQVELAQAAARVRELAPLTPTTSRVNNFATVRSWRA